MPLPRLSLALLVLLCTAAFFSVWTAIGVFYPWPSTTGAAFISSLATGLSTLAAIAAMLLFLSVSMRCKMGEGLATAYGMSSFATAITLLALLVGYEEAFHPDAFWTGQGGAAALLPLEIRWAFILWAALSTLAYGGAKRLASTEKGQEFLLLAHACSGIVAIGVATILSAPKWGPPFGVSVAAGFFLWSVALVASIVHVRIREAFPVRQVEEAKAPPQPAPAG